LKAAGLDIVEDRREGASVWDITGRRYIDCTTGMGCFNVGRRHPRVVKALKEALDLLDTGIFLMVSRQKAQLARRLAEITPGNLTCTLFGTGGGEANDAAIKLARGFTGCKEILYAERGYHGHTGFALSAIGREAYREPFEPLMPGFRRVPFGDVEALEKAISGETAAVLLEPIQGEAGIRIPPDDYLQTVRRLCDENGALLILDEVQTGFGRTGRMFACEHWGVVPDILTVAKSLGGSLYPISATIYREDLLDFFIAHPFIHLSTFGGSDLGCVVALAVIDVIQQEGLVERARAMGERFAAGFEVLKRRYPGLLLEVRQKGLMMGLQFTNASIGPRMSYQLAQRGVLAIYSGNDPSVMRLMPPLVIGEEEVDQVLEALDEAMAQLMKEPGIGKED
jgi:acetylornithine/succinyldiaminopimelate/putrescine aminotransferase